ncbi:MAG: hypothetical protein ACYTHM_24840 [Planctomycetota bacterium]|jgi:hypothetical protein
MKSSVLCIPVLLLLLSGVVQGQETGQIQVRCEPGVRIFLDGTFKGVTKAEVGGLVLRDVPAGPHTIRAVKEGCKPQEETLTLQSGAVCTFTVKPFERRPEERHDVETPPDPGPPSEELKALALRLGALNESHWKPAEEKLKTLGEAAIPGLTWGLKFPLQIVRARCCTILSRMRKSESMIPGAIAALKIGREDVTPFEAGIRRWAAKLLCDLPTFHTEMAMRMGLEVEKDWGVRVLLAAGLTKRGYKDHVPLLLQGMAAEEGEVASWAASAFAESFPDAGLDAKGFGSLPKKEREAKAGETKAWWKENGGKVRPVLGGKNLDPWPVDVKVKVYVPPSKPLTWEDEREVELCLKDAEAALLKKNLRMATARYAAAFRFSGRRRFDIAIKQHDCWRRLGPDNAEKSYHYLRKKLIPMDPLNWQLWLAAAKSVWASRMNDRDKRVMGWTKECLKMVLILVPDQPDAAKLLGELEKSD